MTLRTIQHLGYRIPDLAWLTLREIEYFFDDEDETETSRGRVRRRLHALGGGEPCPIASLISAAP